MAEDIAPKLIEDITEEFHKLYNSSGAIQSLLKKVQQGTATYAEAQQYSLAVSRLIGKAYESHISSATLPDGKMYYNIASRLIPSTLDENYKLVSDYSVKMQQALNASAGLGLKAQTAEQNRDRVDGLVNLASNADQYDDTSKKLLTAIENYCLNIVDETIKANADFQYQAGLRPKIIRKAERKCCEWCSQLAREYDYPDVPKDVYRRHENCRCTIQYDPGDGKHQDVHTKQWTDPEESDMMVKRKVIGLQSGGATVNDISAHAFQRIQERNVTIEAVKDAIENPLDISQVKYDELSRPSIKITGSKATISINPDTGIITTAYPTHKKTANKLQKRK